MTKKNYGGQSTQWQFSKEIAVEGVLFKAINR